MADRTTGELPAVKVGDLPLAPDVYDDALLPVELQGSAMHITGAQWKRYAVTAVKTYSDSASQSAAAAQGSAERAITAMNSIQGALDNLPAGDTLIINDLTTGGTTAALSAEMGKVLGQRPNPNLLHNWYFANPVNQRGFSTTSVEAYTIDRWYATLYRTGTKSVTLNNGVMTITCQDPQENAYMELVQYIDTTISSYLVGKQITVSVLTSTGVHHKTFVLVNKHYHSFGIENGSDVFIYVNSAGVGSVRIRCYYGQTVNIIAAKLELGDTQTLAHQDANGNWVLNEIPDYGEELRKCQRYFRRLGSNTYGQIGYGLCHSDGVIGVYPSCPTAMRIIPSVTLTGNIIAVDPTISGSAANIKLQLNGTGVNQYTPAETGVIKLNFEAVTGTLTPGRVYSVQAQGGGYVDLSADL